MAAQLRRLRWAVVIVDLEPVQRHEQGGSRRALIVSNEPFHRSGRLTVCPITTAWSEPRYPNEVAIRRGEAGQTRDGVILCHQLRTISASRVHTDAVLPGQGIQYVSDPSIRRGVRQALHRHLGLDLPAARDGAD